MDKSDVEKPKKVREKTSKSKYSCPENLAHFLAMLDAVRTVELPDPDEIPGKFETFFNKLPKEFTEPIKETALFFTNLKYFSGDEKFKATLSANLIWEYRQFLATRREVTVFTQQVNSARRAGLPIWEFVELPKNLTSENKREITKANILIAEPLGFDGVMNRVDLERLRDCEICNRIFWAKYKNSETCSQPCRTVFRKRNYRKKIKIAAEKDAS